MPQNTSGPARQSMLGECREERVLDLKRGLEKAASKFWGGLC